MSEKEQRNSEGQTQRLKCPICGWEYQPPHFPPVTRFIKRNIDFRLTEIFEDFLDDPD